MATAWGRKVPCKLCPVVVLRKSAGVFDETAIFFLNEVVDRHRRVQQEQASSKFVRNTNAVRLSSETCQRTGSEKKARKCFGNSPRSWQHYVARTSTLIHIHVYILQGHGCIPADNGESVRDPEDKG